MRENDFSNPIFHDEARARAWLEARLWPEGPICPKCGVVGQATLMKGKTTRAGLYQCNAKECREPFTVTVGTLYERSHVPLHKWLAATHLMMASKKGMSALQISRMIGVTYKTAWFLCHRIRESLRGNDTDQLGGEGVVVEADETYVGGLEKNKHADKRLGPSGPTGGKEAVVALVERGGRVRSHHVGDVTSSTLRPILTAQINSASHLMTDTARMYPAIGGTFAAHSMVNHTINEYVRGDASTNTVESYFAILKRGVIGTFHHVSSQHLKRYVGEFDYRYNTRTALGYSDFDRFTASFPGIVGKRLTYRRTGGEQAAQRPKPRPRGLSGKRAKLG
jgi:transposase-like protein